ncbi:MAG TPA: hypothetical protein VL485_16325 [Ktedonobacteraceae bacterium]|jgi:hypothetical protein|nr:hypothetical protein [Ktedonobacteraceae bacterium]
MQMNRQSPNPYHYYDAVRESSMFFGRQRELQIIYQALMKHQSVSLVGARHIGKSTLLQFLGNRKIQQHYGFDLQHHIFIMTDWRGYLQKSREDFFSALYDQVIAQSQDLITFRSHTLSGEDNFRKLLEEIKNNGFHPVLLMDGFDRVTSNIQFDPHFFSFLRSLAGINDLLTYVTSTIKPLHKVCHSDAVAQSPFFNIFLTCSLGPLTHEEAREMIISPAQQTPYTFLPTEVDWLLKQAGQHPFFLQIACRHLFTEKMQQIHENSAIQFEQVWKSIYEELLPHFNQAWEDLESEQRIQLTTEIFQDAQPGKLFLELSGSLLFRKHLRATLQDNLSSISIKDLREALDHLDDLEFLTQCKLGNLRSLSLQSDASDSLLPTKQGIQVRALLKKAFEQMRPAGLRNDSELEWRSYNILWYHYFRYHLPNQKTAARLGISSTRQFYREQDKAIQELLKEVLELEAKTLNEIE